MVLITIGVTAAVAVVTGLVTFFATRSGTDNGNSGATAEIRNDVNIEEKIESGTGNVSNIIMIMILTIIALVKIIELAVFFVNRCKRSMKKKYERNALAIVSTGQSATPTATVPVTTV